MGRKFGYSFSWKRVLGVSAMKGRVARATGIPTSRSGRERKIGRALSGGGCLIAMIYFGVILASAAVALACLLY